MNGRGSLMNDKVNYHTCDKAVVSEYRRAGKCAQCIVEAAPTPTPAVQESAKSLTHGIQNRGNINPEATDLENLRKYVEYFAGIHDEDCPADDTCNCSGCEINASVNRICNMAAPTPEPTNADNYAPKFTCDHGILHGPGLPPCPRCCSIYHQAAAPTPEVGPRIDDAFVEAVEAEVGHGSGAWDLRDPKEICRAVLKVACTHPPASCEGGNDYMHCSACGEFFDPRQRRHLVHAENACKFGVKEGAYHAKCCPLH